MVVVAAGDADRYGNTAREHDAQTGLRFHRARVLIASANKWLSEDPLGFRAGDPNLYRVSGNAGPTGSDPSGLLFPLGLLVPPPNGGGFREHNRRVMGMMDGVQKKLGEVQQSLTFARRPSS